MEEHFRERPSSVRITSESREVLRNPEQVFDSDLERAQRESEKVLDELIRAGRMERRLPGVEFIVEREGAVAAPSIQIICPKSEAQATQLCLSPLVTSRGPEAGILGYIGTYGIGKRKNNSWVPVAARTYPLEHIFAAPVGVHFVVMPTVDRWAVGRDVLSLPSGNSYELYMGLGFLLLGERWMHIGMHEAGHLPDVDDENEAWHLANTRYAGLHKGSHGIVIHDNSFGLFDLLTRPDSKFSTHPTIGQIEQYGLTSHFVGGNAWLPRIWRKKADTTIRRFEGIIAEAQRAYGHVLRG